MSEFLSEEASDRETHRSLLGTLCGFSFTGLLALVALPGDLKNRALPIWYILVSFVSYLGALNLQGYKSHRWHDQIGDALTETASLGLIASVIGFIVSSDLALGFRIFASVLSGAVWLFDFSIRFRYSRDFLRAKEQQEHGKV